MWLERVAHRVSAGYAETWWTDETVAELEAKMPDGPYLRAEGKAAGLGGRGFYFRFSRDNEVAAGAVQTKKENKQ